MPQHLGHAHGKPVVKLNVRAELSKRFVNFQGFEKGFHWLVGGRHRHPLAKWTDDLLHRAELQLLSCRFTQKTSSKQGLGGSFGDSVHLAVLLF